MYHARSLEEPGSGHGREVWDSDNFSDSNFVGNNRFDKDGSGELDFHEFLDLRETMIPQAGTTGSKGAKKSKRKKKRL